MKQGLHSKGYKKQFCQQLEWTWKRIPNSRWEQQYGQHLAGSQPCVSLNRKPSYAGPRLLTCRAELLNYVVFKSLSLLHNNSKLYTAIFKSTVTTTDKKNNTEWIIFMYESNHNRKHVHHIILTSYFADKRTEALKIYITIIRQVKIAEQFWPDECEIFLYFLPLSVCLP